MDIKRFPYRVEVMTIVQVRNLVILFEWTNIYRQLVLHQNELRLLVELYPDPGRLLILIVSKRKKTFSTFYVIYRSYGTSILKFIGYLKDFFWFDRLAE